jgi:uncharacterized short protein YbdD (DUF466 family)
MRGLMRRIVRVARTVIGVPDYDRYLAHVRVAHPERTPLSRDEFMRQRMETRYSTPGSRCC